MEGYLDVYAENNSLFNLKKFNKKYFKLDIKVPQLEIFLGKNCQDVAKIVYPGDFLDCDGFS